MRKDKPEILDRLEIRPMKRTDEVESYLDFICELIDEGTYLQMNKKPTLKEERKWFSGKLASIRRKNEICLTAWAGKLLVGSCEARRGPYKERDNVSLGIAIRKGYRGKGLGEYLLRSLIALAKKKLKPKNLYLSASAKNKPALALYRKIGFVEFARFPKWDLETEGYCDRVFMVLR